ncbi:MAG: VOC family protein [Actinomycetota bacterium]
MIRWMTAFVDRPVGTIAAATSFWAAATATRLSPSRGDRDEFRTLVPSDGDPHLRVQAVTDGPGGVHLDLHVADIEVLADRAVGLGASVVARPGHVVLRSPGGLLLCAVGHHGEHRVPEPVSLPDGGTTRVDQVSIDVPGERFDDEIRFWSDLTGWPLRPSRLPEFVALDRPAGFPWRVLLHRLGDDDAGTTVRAHLDVACGASIDAAIDRHQELGAERGRDGVVWTTMTDPTGFEYCLTRRDPETGLLTTT